MYFDGTEPTRAHSGDAGYDLRAAETWVLDAGERALFPTGTKVSMPDNMVGLIHPRSGLALNEGVTVLNAPGTIDSNYRGDIGVILINLSGGPVKISRGERIAQLVFQRVEHPALVADDLDVTDRGTAGFGSTGR